MIETEQTIAIEAPIAQVWACAQNIEGWARLMPGLQDCTVVDESDSRWTLKVGAGALVRTVKVAVHVDRWAGPGAVDFTYALQGDPVKGGGTYRARSLAPDRTEVVLAVRVEGTGPMAPMWEAMGRPLLPRFAQGFAEQFKADVERLAPLAEPVPETLRRPLRRSLLARLVAWLRAIRQSRALKQPE